MNQTIDVISRFCHGELRPFYAQLGFQARGQQVVLHKKRRSAPYIDKPQEAPIGCRIGSAE